MADRNTEVTCGVCHAPFYVNRDGHMALASEWRRPAPAVSRPHTTSGEFEVRPFEGSLQNFSIVDVLQLLHTSRKTGILRAASPSGRARILLRDGHIVGCRHPNEDVAVGQILVEMSAVTQPDVDQALEQQRQAGQRRHPLIATLVEMGVLDEDVGWKALIRMVEMTIVEVLGWQKGTFTFHVGEVATTDSFRHVPDGVTPAIDLDTQSALMEAVRILDEQNRPSGQAPAPDSRDPLSLLEELDDLAVGGPPVHTCNTTANGPPDPSSLEPVLSALCAIKECRAAAVLCEGQVLLKRDPGTMGIEAASIAVAGLLDQSKAPCSNMRVGTPTALTLATSAGALLAQSAVHKTGSLVLVVCLNRGANHTLARLLLAKAAGIQNTE
ncbi:MAG: DUF4388 domain-containing protein [candidate division NC10 bacterium]